MTNKQILHRILLGMDPYLSVGVPTPYWELAIELTKEIYGEAGVEILNSAHQTYDNAVDCRDEIIVHSLQKWEDGGNTEITPKEIIERLEAMSGKVSGIASDLSRGTLDDYKGPKP